MAWHTVDAVAITEGLARVTPIALVVTSCLEIEAKDRERLIPPVARRSAGSRSILTPVTTKTSESRALSCKSIRSVVKVLLADSARVNDTTICSDVAVRPLGIPYHDRRRVIVVVETLESLTYHGIRWFSGY
jgi:hypothetical protein